MFFSDVPFGISFQNYDIRLVAAVVIFTIALLVSAGYLLWRHMEKEREELLENLKSYVEQEKLLNSIWEQLMTKLDDQEVFTEILKNIVRLYQLHLSLRLCTGEGYRLCAIHGRRRAVGLSG